MEEQIGYLIKIFQRRLATTPMSFFRYLYKEIDWNDTLIGIKGPKGCGKSTLLLQHIKETFKGKELEKVLYVSLDNLWFSSHDIIDVVDYHYTHGGTHLFIDEIHYYKHWQTLLKNISDDFPGLHVVYTGSSMLQLESSEGDLSRRLTMYEMRGLSLREFLAYDGVLQISSVTLDELLENHVGIAMEVCAKTKVLQHFKKYLQIGYYPFYKTVHHGYYQRLQSVANQVIEVDYPNVEDITMPTIRKTKKLLMILAERVPQLPKMNELYKELETDRNQGLKMLYALQRAGLLQLLSDDAKRLDNLSRPDKIYISNPTMMYALTPKVDIGTLRETFFINQLSQGHDLRYPKAGDFLVDKRFLFEVGGKGKKFDQIKDIPDSFLAVDDTEVGYGNRIPLWMFGLLY
ncbi:MAG: ATP-binding protein [Muribaculaceae bacterium]|nr:ATP-binding protein [Muribaculaceae bacterium]